MALADAQRQQQADALNAQAAERDRDRQAALERERLRTERAHAEAEARRPIIVGHSATAVVGLRFNAGQVQRARGTVRLNPGFTPDPRTLNGRAGGDVSAAQMNLPQGCTGFYSGAPAQQVFLARDFNFLRMETSAPTDTTLAVVAPDGSVWCDDDGAGNTNARIAGQFPAGPYQVFVGNYQQGVVSPFQLVITEYEAQGQAPVAMAAPPPVVAPPPPPPRAELHRRAPRRGPPREQPRSLQRRPRPLRRRAPPGRAPPVEPRPLPRRRGELRRAAPALGPAPVQPGPLPPLSAPAAGCVRPAVPW